MATVSSRTTLRIVLGAEERGVDANELCRAAGLSLESLRKVDTPVDAERYVAVWSEAVNRLGDPSFPIQVACSGAESQNVLRFICMTCSSLGEAFSRASRYLQVLTDAVTWPVTESADRITIAIARPAHARPGLRHPDEFALAEMVALGREFTGVDWTPLEVRFAHAASTDDSHCTKHFRSPVRFSADRPAIDVPRSVADLPLLKADPSMRAFFEEVAERDLLLAPPPPSARDLVRAKLQRAYCGETPTIDQVAEEIGISARTLRRRLQSEAVSFQKLLDEIRFDAAKRHLAEAEISIPELAFVLGFSDARAFYRAFRRWTGTTPQAYRAR